MDYWATNIKVCGKGVSECICETENVKYLKTVWDNLPNPAQMPRLETKMSTMVL